MASNQPPPRFDLRDDDEPVCVVSPFDCDEPWSKPRAHSAIYATSPTAPPPDVASAFDPFGHYDHFPHTPHAPSASDPHALSTPAFKHHQMRDDEMPVYFADDHHSQSAAARNQKPLYQQRRRARTEMPRRNSDPSMRGTGRRVEDEGPRNHICPTCFHHYENPLPALVLRCPHCESNYCFFCSKKRKDSLPCILRACKAKRKRFWKEENDFFSEYNVAPLKDPKGKRVKRKAQNVGYVAGAGALGAAGCLMVTAGVLGVPFTAGFSLVLVPMALAPFHGAKETWRRKSRWSLHLKDKKRQSVRSQIIQSQSQSQIERSRNEEVPERHPQSQPNLPIQQSPIQHL